MLWLGSTMTVLAYAAGDRLVTPHLAYETTFSMRPDLAQLGELVHWGGRLLQQGQWGLLITNALIFGAVIALVLAMVIPRFQAKRSDAEYAFGEDVDE